jgi:hypothetical protein
VFELASFAEEEKTQLLLFSTAWVYDHDYIFVNEEKATEDAINYWISRF